MSMSAKTKSALPSDRSDTSCSPPVKTRESRSSSHDQEPMPAPPALPRSCEGGHEEEQLLRRQRRNGRRRNSRFLRPTPSFHPHASAIGSAWLLSFSFCRAQDGYDGEGGGGDNVFGVWGATDSLTSYGLLIIYGLVFCILGWTALLYPFVFCPKFDETVRDFTSRGIKLQGRILSMRRGRVFNPLRYCLPTRYNCYVTVEYNGTRKELAVDEIAMDMLAERTDGNVDVYALPGYPQSGILDGTLQSHVVTFRAKVLHVLAAVLLLGLGVYMSLVSPAQQIYSSNNLWKFWLVLLGHFVALGIAHWACNFVHMTRVEALLYGTVDADGLQEYAETHQLANRGCSRGAMEMSGSAAAAAAQLEASGVTALADSRDEDVSEPSSRIVDETFNAEEEAKNYQAMA